MHEVVFTSILTREVVREMERRFEDTQDPHSLSQYEMWDSAFARPTMAERIRGLVARFTRRSCRVDQTPKKECSGQISASCPPQILFNK